MKELETVVVEVDGAPLTLYRDEIMRDSQARFALETFEMSCMSMEDINFKRQQATHAHTAFKATLLAVATDYANSRRNATVEPNIE